VGGDRRLLQDLAKLPEKRLAAHVDVIITAASGEVLGVAK
jgi:hypothetical protein